MHAALASHSPGLHAFKHHGDKGHNTLKHYSALLGLDMSAVDMPISPTDLSPYIDPHKSIASVLVYGVLMVYMRRPGQPLGVYKPLAEHSLD